MKLCLVLSFMLATGLARRWSRGPSRTGATPGKNKPPPPPPLTESRSVAAGNRQSQNSKYVYDINCKSGRWIKVTSEDCLVAFEDPDFDYYESFCGSEMADQHKEWYEDEVQGVWTYPEYGYCEALPTKLACPALEKCDDGPPPPPDN